MVRQAAMLLGLLRVMSAASLGALEPSTSLDEYARASWTVKEGLPSNLIWAIAQDSNGYLWFGTDAGLVRFDGVRFSSWADLGRPAMPATAVRVLLASRAGDFWIGFGEAGGVARLRGEQLTTFGGSDGVPERTVALLEDREGAIWAGGVGGLSRFSGNKWERIGEADGLNDEAIVSLYQDRHETIWVVTVRSTFKRLLGTTRFERVPVNFTIRAFTEDTAGRLWFSSADSGAGELEPFQSYRRSDRLRSLNASRLLRDRHGNLWVGTLGQGIWRVSGASNRSDLAIEQLDGQPGLRRDAVRSLFEDREGNIWIGTHNGINRLSERSPVHMSSEQNVSRSVRAVTASKDGSIWAGTEDGLYRFSREAPDQFEHYDHRHGLPNATVNAIYSDHDGVLWVTTFGGGVVRLKGQRFERALPEGVPAASIWALTSDREGGLWLCENFKNLSLWKNGTLFPIERTSGVLGIICNSVYTDTRGRVWVGFADGTVSVRENGKFRSFSTHDGLAGGSVSAIVEDDEGAVWIGSKEGLTRFGTDNRFVSILGRTRAPISDVRGIAFDRLGYIWLGVSAGILRLDARHFDRLIASPSEPIDYILYDTSDGLRGLPMSPRGYPTAARAGDGRLWFVTSDGLAAIDPQAVRAPTAPPPVRIEDIHADGQSLSLRPPIALKPLTSTIQLDYTALTFSNPAKTRFRYKLEGFDGDWIDAGTRRQAFYTNLPPRNYRFRVASGAGSVWDSVGASLDFSIQPAFYQSRWFYAASLVTLASALLISWRVRAEHLRQRFAFILKERARVARDIHDTLLQSLVGMAFQFDALEGELETSRESAQKRLKRLRIQVSMHIRDFRESISALRSDSITERSLEKSLNSIVDMTVDDVISCDLTVRGTPRTLSARAEEVLIRAAQESTSNAVRHGRATHITITLSYLPDAVTLRIVDDGCGFAPKAQMAPHSTHWGLAIMHERARQIGGTLTIASVEGGGTTIEVAVPTTTSFVS